MTVPIIVSLPEDRFDELKPLWRALYDHHSTLTPHLRDREVPFVRVLVVLPDARGQGAGSTLLDAVEAKLQELGIQDMVIAVVTTNTEAIRLYERRGAVPFITQFVQRVQPGRG